jgi:hypothetical protein
MNSSDGTKRVFFNERINSFRAVGSIDLVAMDFNPSGERGDALKIGEL